MDFSVYDIYYNEVLNKFIAFDMGGFVIYKGENLSVDKRILESVYNYICFTILKGTTVFVLINVDAVRANFISMETGETVREIDF